MARAITELQILVARTWKVLVSSERVGVQARILPIKNPHWQYMHALQWTLFESRLGTLMQTPIYVRKVTDMMTAACLFFNGSPKREGLLKNVIITLVPYASQRKPLLDLCKTRWAERQDAYRHFYWSYLYLVKTLEVIAHEMHHNKGFNEDLKSSHWSTKSKADSGSLLASLSSFDNIVTFVVVYQLLSHISGLALKLQSRSLDIVDA